WRTAGGLELRRHEHAASMRPRSEDRGEPPAPLRGGPSFQSFNAATVRRPWRTKSHLTHQRELSSLQCGHGPKTVENCLRRKRPGQFSLYQLSRGPVHLFSCEVLPKQRLTPQGICLLTFKAREGCGGCETALTSKFSKSFGRHAGTKSLPP